MPSPVTTLPRARSSMVEDAQVGRRRALLGPRVRAWGASAVAAVASVRALFSIMLTFVFFTAVRCRFARKLHSGSAVDPL